MIKIKNLKYNSSKLKEDISLAELMGKRNRLLITSDWTQLPDVDLTKECKAMWAEWRAGVRKIELSDVGAMASLVELEKNKPQKIYNENVVKDITELTAAPSVPVKDYRHCLEDGRVYLNEVYKSAINNLNFNLIDELKYKEALSYLTDDSSNYTPSPLNIYPLLRTHVMLTGKSAEIVAKEFLEEKKKAMGKFIALEQSYYKACAALNNTTTIEEIETIKKEMDNAVWTLTLI